MNIWEQNRIDKPRSIKIKPVEAARVLDLTMHLAGQPGIDQARHNIATALDLRCDVPIFDFVFLQSALAEDGPRGVLP